MGPRDTELQSCNRSACIIYMVAKWFCIALFATTAQSPLGCTTLAVGIQRLTLHFFLSGDHSVLPLIGVVKMKNDNAFADISRKPSSHYEFLKSICAFDVCYFVVHCPFWWFVLVQIWSVSAVNTTITHLKKGPTQTLPLSRGHPGYHHPNTAQQRTATIIYHTKAEKRDEN